MQIRIEAVDLPGRSCAPSPDVPGGYHNVHVGVQRRSRPNELFGLVAGDAPSATWALEGTAVRLDDGFDLKGPYVQGRCGGRFVYLCWGAVDDAENFSMFRRAKLWFDAIPAEVVDSAVRQGVLVGHLGLTDHHGNPLCAAVRPPLIAWSAEPGEETGG